jgi:hypothetical protein
MADSEELFKLSNCELLRIDVDTEHYYYGGEAGGEKQYYISLTKVLDIGAPFPEGLRQWLRLTSFEEQQERLAFTGNRGTKLHEALDLLMSGQELNLETDYPSEYEKDAVISFMRFMRFLSPSKWKTELTVADPQLRVAGTLDFRGLVEDWRLTALLNPIKYLDIDSEGDFQLKEKWVNLADKPKKIMVVIDWKFTGRNAYSHKVQVAGYKTMNNKSRSGTLASRAFTWRYSNRHKAGFDFQESLLNYRSFKRVYDTTIEYLGEFPNPPQIKRFPKKVKLYGVV